MTTKLLDRHRCRLSTSFEKIGALGQGTFGEVWKARCKETQAVVALKKIKLDDDGGFPMTALREYMILKSIEHENVLRVLDIAFTITGDVVNSIYMVSEYMDHDLTGLLGRNDLELSTAQLKCYAKQLLTGLFHIHVMNILHRDMKCSNILVNNSGVLKLADFGLARTTVTKDRIAKRLTPGVVTLWYRPPEIILGSAHYDAKADLWGAGCIIAEMFTRKPLFDGHDSMTQMTKISHLCGAPVENNWEGVSKLPDYGKYNFNINAPRNLRRQLPRMSKESMPESAVSLIDQLLTLNPAKRLDADEALDHEFFWVEPPPTRCEDMPCYPETHEMDVRGRPRNGSRENDGNSRNSLTHHRSRSTVRKDDWTYDQRGHHNNYSGAGRSRKGGRDGRSNKLKNNNRAIRGER